MDHDTKSSVLIVEDDATIARAVELELTHNGFSTARAADAHAAYAAIESNRPDAIILDLMLPGEDGLDVAKNIRRQGLGVPILMLTARAETEDLVSGFEAGADDYLRKPFEMPELMSRLRALLKRTERARPERVFSASGVKVDVDRRRVIADGKNVSLTAKEFDLLAYLVANAGRVVSRDEILESVWSGQHATDSNVIEVFVCHLRNKIGDRDNSVIQTVRGVGYFFSRA